MSDTEFVTVWSCFPTSRDWLVERTYAKHYAVEALGLAEGAEVLHDGRLYCWRPMGETPEA